MIPTHCTLVLVIAFVYVFERDGVLRVSPETLQVVPTTARCHTWNNFIKKLKRIILNNHLHSSFLSVPTNLTGRECVQGVTEMSLNNIKQTFFSWTLLFTFGGLTISSYSRYVYVRQCGSERDAATCVYNNNKCMYSKNTNFTVKHQNNKRQREHSNT